MEIKTHINYFMLGMMWNPNLNLDFGSILFAKSSASFCIRKRRGIS